MSNCLLEGTRKIERRGHMALGLRRNQAAADSSTHEECVIGQECEKCGKRPQQKKTWRLLLRCFEDREEPERQSASRNLNPEQDKVIRSWIDNIQPPSQSDQSPTELRLPIKEELRSKKPQSKSRQRPPQRKSMMMPIVQEKVQALEPKAVCVNQQSMPMQTHSQVFDLSDLIAPRNPPIRDPAEDVDSKTNVPTFLENLSDWTKAFSVSMNCSAPRSSFASRRQ
mmetsp:Transcript_11233/g.31277  ORF Transcript_11233/g.31277 Transcript_11233/m.31277 type:complete len:225 (+) Transcript_11233:59-733(+)